MDGKGFPVQKAFKLVDKENRAITFDEFTIPNETPSELDWRDTDITGKFSRHIEAPNPILTSPMTTVTEDAMAIEAAKNGAGGVIHCANTPGEQKKMVRRVKLHLNGIVDEPIFATTDASLREVQEQLENQGFDFKSLPVLDENRRFVGLLTNTVFKLYEDQPTSVVEDVMIPASRVPTATNDLRENPQGAFDVMKQEVTKLLPLLDEQGRLDGMYLLDDVQRILRGNPEKYALDADGRLRTFMAVSTWAQDGIERVQESGKYLDMVVIDTSHGESKYTFNALKAMREACRLVKNLREEHGAIDIMVGNVSDPESAIALAKAGADAIRVGRGPGGICISRERLGGGTPQASAIYNCAKAVKKIDKKIAICADGGVRGPGDYSKALMLGANCIMVGGLVAATDEATGERVTLPDGRDGMEYNGMASPKELKKSWSARLRYDHNFEIPNLEDDDIFVEGVEKVLPLKGPVSKVFRDLSRGVRVEMAVGGFNNLEAFRKGGRMTFVSAAANAEGGASK